MPRARYLSWALAGLAAAIATLPWVAEAADAYLEVPPSEIVDRSPAYLYANMGVRAALAELDRRKILYQLVEPQPGVRTPIRLTGKLHGVHIHSALPEHERPTTPFELCDARLALALDDFSALLARHDIVEAIHFTMYRPSVARSYGSVGSLGPVRTPFGSWLGQADEAFAKKARSGKSGSRSDADAVKRSFKVRKSGARPTPKRVKLPAGRGGSQRDNKPTGSTQSRHSAGLAIDVGVLVKRDGSLLSVASHFQGRIGVRTCGPGASAPRESRAKELWDIVCEAYDARIFTYVLTPNFDRPHQDHFHLDIKPDVRWFLYH